MTTLTTTDAIDGTTATAAFINNNFAAVEAVVNGNLDNANVNAAAAIAVSKLAAGSAYQVLTTVSGVPTWSAGHVVYDRSISDVTVASTTTNTPLYTKTVTGGHMSTNRVLRLTLSGHMTKNASGTLTLRLEWGAGLIVARPYTITNNATSGNYRWQLFLEIQNQNSASSQWVTWRFLAGLNDTTDSIDVHDISTLADSADTSVDCDLEVQAQWSAADSSLSITKSSALLELL